MRKMLRCGIATVLSVVLGVSVVPVPQAQASALKRSYIVTLHHRSDIDDVVAASKNLGAKRFNIFRYALGGFATDLSDAAASTLRHDTRVKRVTKNVAVHKREIPPIQLGAPYQLDRIDQRALPIDDRFSSPATGEGVQIYMIDTGVRATHVDLVGRVIAGVDVVGNDESGSPSLPASDCDGHGTHTAATAAGTTFGVAKKATIIAVRVLNCAGDGDVEGVVAGIDWVLHHHRSGVLAVANLSLGVNADDNSLPMDDAVRDLYDDGIVPVVAAGNDGKDACQTSPGHLPEALNVGAVNSQDDRFNNGSIGSNYGTCLDLFAPGVRVLSAGSDSDTETHYETGTSMASPLVAGYAALLAQQFPNACPVSIEDAITARATTNVVKNAGTGSPNLLLNVVDISAVGTAAPGTPNALVSTPKNEGLVVSWDPGCGGGAVSGTNTVQVSVSGTKNPFRTIKVNDAAGEVVLKGLDNSKKYVVRVRRQTPNGRSDWSVPSLAMSPKPLVTGQKVLLNTLARSTEATIGGQWQVSAESSGVCRVTANAARMYFMRKGSCGVAVQPQYTNVPFARTFSVGESTAPANSGRGMRIVYSRSSRRLFAIEASNGVKRSMAVVAPEVAPTPGSFSLAILNNGLLLEAQSRTGKVAASVLSIPTQCDASGVCVAAYSPDTYGTSQVQAVGIYIPTEDLRWFARWGQSVKTFVIIR